MVQADVHTRIAALEAELASLKASVEPPSEPATTDRRGLVRLLAAGAAGAIGGAVALSSQPATAADSDPVLLGAANDATNATILTASAGSALLLVGAPYGLETDGSSGNALFVAAGPSPVGRAALAGVLYVDGTGTWWISVVENASAASAAVWRSIGGPTSAGQLNLLPAPRRAYDSRPGGSPTPGGNGALLAGGSRAINLTQGTANGVLGAAVPAGASAALISLTVTRTVGGGYIGVFSNAVAYSGTSNVNWTASGQDVAVTTVTAVDAAGACRVQNGPGANTDFLIDVIGYYI